MNSIRCLIFCF